MDRILGTIFITQIYFIYKILHIKVIIKYNLNFTLNKHNLNEYIIIVVKDK